MVEVAPLSFLQAHKSEMEILCRQYHVKQLYLLGSALTSKFRPDSDLDFLVTFHDVEQLEYADNFFDFRDALAHLFQRKVDLVESQTLKKSLLQKCCRSHKSDHIWRTGSRNGCPIFARQELSEEENHHLSALRDWLLPMLMNGQVRVGD